jgi:hypothetical protein
MVNCATSTGVNDRHIVALNVQELEFPLEEQAGFSLEGKTPAEYALLLAAIVFAVLTLVALIVCVLEKGLQRKWLWIIFILVGFGQLSVYWNAGTWRFAAAHLTLFSAGAVSRGYGGWVISVGLPVGAAVYLARWFLNHRAAARSKVG